MCLIIKMIIQSSTCPWPPMNYQIPFFLHTFIDIVDQTSLEIHKDHILSLLFVVSVHRTDCIVTCICVYLTIVGHKSAVCHLAGEGDMLVSGDEDGHIFIWKAFGTSVQQTLKISGMG